MYTIIMVTRWGNKGACLEKEIMQGTMPGAPCTQARKTTHGLDVQHQYLDSTARGRVNQNDRGQR